MGEEEWVFPLPTPQVHKPRLFWPEGRYQDQTTLVCLPELLENLLKDLLGREGIGKYPYPVQDKRFCALWSGVGDTKVAHLVLNLVAKRSRLG